MKLTRRDVLRGAFASTVAGLGAKAAWSNAKTYAYDRPVGRTGDMTVLSFDGNASEGLGFTVVVPDGDPQSWFWYGLSLGGPTTRSAIFCMEMAVKRLADGSPSQKPLAWQSRFLVNNRSSLKVDCMPLRARPGEVYQFTLNRKPLEEPPQRAPGDLFLYGLQCGWRKEHV